MSHTPRLFYGEPPIEGKPYQFLGSYILKFGKEDTPRMGFYEAEDCAGLNPAAYRECVEALKSSMASHKTILSAYGENTGEGMEARTEIDKIYAALAHAQETP